MTPGAGGAKESSMTGLPRREARPRRRAAWCDGGFEPDFGCARRLEAKRVQVWAVAEGGAGRLICSKSVHPVSLSPGPALCLYLCLPFAPSLFLPIPVSLPVSLPPPVLLYLSHSLTLSFMGLPGARFFAGTSRTAGFG